MDVIITKVNTSEDRPNDESKQLTYIFIPFHKYVSVGLELPFHPLST